MPKSSLSRRFASAPPLLALSLTALLAALPPAPARAQEDDPADYSGTFLLAFEAPKNASFGPTAELLESSEIFQITVDALNETIALPADLPILFTECGTVNAFYDSQNVRILMCYELTAFFAEQLAERYEDAAAAEQAVIDATLFVFQHELGHALVHLLELPITGKEEDAVDDLATLVLLHEWEGGDESALNAAEAFYALGELQEAAVAENAENAPEILPYYGEHSLGKQRYYQVVCIVYGSDPEAHAHLVPDALPESRAVRCPAEYEQKANSWDILLADYYFAADDEATAEGPDASGDEAADADAGDGG
jgi:hypothetical protein